VITPRNCDEHRECPEDFQQRITEAGGVNKYDEPMFRIAWQRSETYRAGGIWAGGGQPTFIGYRDIPLSFDPGWAILQWQPPEKYGTPESYYVANYDEETGLQILGEYPYKGRYEVVIPLVSKTFTNGVLKIEHMELSSLLVDLIVPILKEAEGISFERRRALMIEEKERRDKEEVGQIEASLQNAYPAFGTAPRSAARLACNSVVQKKSEQIERYWRNAVRIIRERGKGLSTGPIQ
jgi:hypothetical protein